MADERDENQCDHELCNCPVSGDADYCSAFCEGASESDTTTIACECGHPGCAAEILS